MKKLKLGDYVKCVIIEKGKPTEPKYGFVVDLNITDTYPYNVKFHDAAVKFHDDAVKFRGASNDGIGIYKANELTVIINDDVIDTFINDMVLI